VNKRPGTSPAHYLVDRAVPQDLKADFLVVLVGMTLMDAYGGSGLTFGHGYSAYCSAPKGPAPYHPGSHIYVQ
jgi:hypothetical protein